MLVPLRLGIFLTDAGPSIPFRQCNRSSPSTPANGLTDQIPFHSFPAHQVPSPFELLVFGSVVPTCFNTFYPTSPLRTSAPLLACADRSESDRSSSRFSPPDCYQLSLAGTSSLLRVRLPPHTALACLELPLDFPYLFPGRYEASPVTASAL